jgi:hypothetical protein
MYNDTHYHMTFENVKQFKRWLKRNGEFAQPRKAKAKTRKRRSHRTEESKSHQPLS